MSVFRNISDYQFTDYSGSIGKDPYDRVTVFARAIVNTTFVQYDSEDLAADPVSGSQIANTTIYAPIYAVAAK